MGPRPGFSHWLAPVAASLAVLAAVLVPTVVTQPRGSGGGPGPDETVDRRLTPDRLALPSPRAGDRRDSRIADDVEITGYQGRGRDLTVYYRVGPRSDCSTAVRRPRVAEMATSVSVRLERVDTARPEEGCEGQSLGSSVDIRLDAPVAGRVVKDMARRGALVPVERPFRSTS